MLHDNLKHLLHLGKNPNNTTPFPDNTIGCSNNKEKKFKAEEKSRVCSDPDHGMFCSNI